ncbi:Cytochrome P450 2C25 [Wickerhamomyces ciferrii]|uniref:Cytochrome P450 2C25 n=1 Tax=Wickerhamomyces ciferrii (strain ATCC 14091 / BCRC 22168 / CBS 111 / JCM 3599 / NBRC 0793 / NRRL Y-1031 F-60-10) TaxID=1206466 RepID=K0KM52_WICCF|nr:Cytochrome P450 2C25 [Wickerhamomyces ciferrii]CCH42459.1 Cytochrome P450 2C25 [Wickerhamomyces ciferrii]
MFNTQDISAFCLSNLTTPFLIVLAWIFLDFIGILSPEKIKNLPSVPGFPIVGNLYQVLSNPAKTYMKWARKYGDVFQMRFGTRIVVVANSFDSVKELWIKNRNANNSRPILYTFHSVVSSTQGFTIGTTPYGDSYKRKKKIVATTLNKKNVEKLSGLMDQECTNMFKRIEVEKAIIDKCSKDKDIDLFKLLQGFVLRVSLYITYGYLVKVEHTDKCKLFDEITHVENIIVRLRGHSSNLQDYLPILRFNPFGEKSQQANDFRDRRDTYMSKFINDLKLKMEKDEDYKDSIVSKSLRGHPDFPTVTEAELKSVCLTMVSAGLDNTPLVLNHIVGHLSQPEYGERLQTIAINEILGHYGDLSTAYYRCSEEIEIDYIKALLKEGLRYFSVLPTSLPRSTTQDIIYKNAVIPKGTILFMNTFAANHDSKHFENPFLFEPSRYLTEDYKMKVNDEGTNSFTFGAGARMCAGSYLANKEMYIALTRLIILYHIKPPKDLKNNLMELDPFKLNSVPDSVAIEPSVYKVRLEKRDPQLFDILIGQNNPQASHQEV